MYARSGYMTVFAMALGLIVFDIVMRLIMIEKKKAAQYKPAIGTANGFYGTFTQEQPSEQEPQNDSTQANKRQDNSQEAPLLSNEPHKTVPKKSKMPTILVLLGTPRLLAAIYGIFVNVSVLCAFDGVLPLHVKSLFGWNSLEAGLIFLCLAIPAMTGPLVGRLCDKFGPRWIAVAGCSLTAPPLILLRLVDHDSLEQKILLCGLLVCCGQSHNLTMIAGPVVYPERSCLAEFHVPNLSVVVAVSSSFVHPLTRGTKSRFHAHPHRFPGCCRPLRRRRGERTGGSQCLRSWGSLRSSFRAVQLLHGGSYTFCAGSRRCYYRASWLGRNDCGDGSFCILGSNSCCKWSDPVPFHSIIH